MTNLSYLDTKGTQAFLSALASDTGIPVSELCEVKTLRELLREYPYQEMAFVDCVNDAISEGLDSLGRF